MSQTLELPDNVYAGLRKAAASAGVTAADWIATRLPESTDPTLPATPDAAIPKTMAEVLAGRIGRIASEANQSNSSECHEGFMEYLEKKKKAGHL